MRTSSRSDPLWDRWEEVDSLFTQLVELAPEKRETRLVERCAGDAELERAVREVLAASLRRGRFETPPDQDLVAAAFEDATGRELEARGDAPLPDRIGLYRVLRPLGRGGMGSVYLAEREDPDFPQRVALKVLRRGVDTEDVVRRFRAERQILALLHHPNIARVFDAGATPDGRPYLVMEHVEGRDIVTHCDTKRLDLEARLRLFMAVARAVTHAHERGVIHRDLKPANILVTEEEEQVRLLDFGIAKILDDPQVESEGSVTRAGVRAMTPGIASPEQLRGLEVTDRSDTYQLGLLLYELLAGRRPPRAALPSDPRDGNLADPPRPFDGSARAEAAAGPGIEVTALTRSLRGDLNAIVSRALEPNPEDRYAAVRDLHDDLVRFLEGVPVRARSRTSFRRRQRRRRRAGGLTAATAVGALIWVGAVAFQDSPGTSLTSPEPGRWLALGPVSAAAGPNGPAVSPQVVSELLATNLARFPAVQVVALHRWTGELDADGQADLQEAAMLAGAHELLTGRLRAGDGSGLRLELVRIDLGSGMTTATYSADGSDPFEVVDRLTEVLLADLGHAPPTRGVASITTSSPVAYRLYEEGLRVYHAGDYPAAHRLFSAALAEDPRFAMAAYRRALTSEDLDFAAYREDLGRAARLADEASERERLLIRNAWALAMDEPNQSALADSLVRLFPAEPEGHLFAGLSRVAAGDFMGAISELQRAASMGIAAAGSEDPACLVCDALEGVVNAYLLADSLSAGEREARRLVALRPGSAGAWRTLATTLEVQGRAEEALAARNLASTLGSENPRDPLFEAILALREGEFARADALLALEEREVDPLVWQNVLWYRTLSARYQGRLDDALVWALTYRETLEAAAAAGHPPVWGPLLEAIVLEELGRPVEAAALWRRIAEGPYEPDSPSRTARHRAWTLTHAAGAHAAAGELALLDGLADTIQALGSQSAYGRDPRLHEYVRGLSLAARGETDAAVQAFRRAVYSLTGGYGRINLELGRGLLTIGAPREAIVVLQGVLRGPLDAANLYVNRTEVHGLLSEAFRAASVPDSVALHAAWVARALSRETTTTAR